ncbi:MAG TPA: LPS assembly protein LptD, partial [Tepidisphaeraceae bacterium]|nr:LPS assembly protein LptD [Tepidisphaeraceae bacterium]
RAMFRPADKAAILTDVVLHTTDPTIGLPVVVRAATMRQISAGEYDATKVTLTQSAFARPSYAIRADKIYVGQTRNAADDGGRRTRFAADNASFQFLGLPLFWLPRVSGEMGGSQIPLRKIRFTNDTRFGTSLLTEWGLLETLGTRHPPGLDASYRLDYYSDRGPGVGFNARYGGSTVTETTRQPWDFEGDFTSYGVYDTGFDQFGGARGRPGTYGPPPDPFKPYPDQDVTRAWIGWRHQHFFPEGWQVQATANYLTDQNFLEQYFESEFDTGGPKSDSLYVKRQDGIQAATFLLDFQPNKFVTTVDLAQEQFEVERYPQVTYHRIGDSWFDDRVTFYSDNSAAALHFQQNRVSLEQQGFALSGTTVPGLPSTGISGTTGETVFRGDARQEVAFPFTIGQFKVVPYVVGRVTAYSESPQGPQRQRLLGAVGARVSTAFWRVDDAVQSDLFDLHRLRHVIEPELHLFASAANVEQGEVYVFDEPVDRVSDIGAAQVAVRQRWQTKRGGPGRWRSVDVFTLDVEANFFNHRPDEAFREPENFRGLFLSSIPEASLPRNSVNAAGAWRISDTTLLISDARYNLDVQDLATASVGLLVQRDARLGYYVGSRYIDPLTSNVTTLGVSYALTSKYSLTFAQSWDFGLNQNVGSTVLLARQFDRFFASVGFQYDAVQEVTSFTLNVYPEGIGFGTGNLASFAGLQRQ